MKKMKMAGNANMLPELTSSNKNCGGREKRDSDSNNPGDQNPSSNPAPWHRIAILQVVLVWRPGGRVAFNP